MAENNTATVSLESGEPVPLEGDELESEDLEHEGGEDLEDDDQEEETWRLMLSEVKDQVTELQTKATESQGMLERVLAASQELQQRLKASPNQSDQEESPPAPTQPPQEPAPNSESSPTQSDDGKSSSGTESGKQGSEPAKPATPTFKKVLRRRRSI